MTLQECKELVETVWRDFYPDEQPPIVKDGRGKMSARANRAFIALPHWTRIAPIVLHETSHGLIEQIYGADYQERLDGHGAEFVRVFIQLLQRYTDCNGKTLFRTAKEHGLDVSDADILTYAEEKAAA